MPKFAHRVRSVFTGRNIYSSTFSLSALTLVYTYMLCLWAHFYILDLYAERQAGMNLSTYIKLLIDVVLYFEVSAEMGEFPLLMSKVFKLFLLFSFFVPWILFSSRPHTRFRLSVLYGLIVNICLSYLYFEMPLMVWEASPSWLFIFLFYIFISVAFFYQGMNITAPGSRSWLPKGPPLQTSLLVLETGIVLIVTGSLCKIAMDMIMPALWIYYE